MISSSSTSLLEAILSVLVGPGVPLAQESVLELEWQLDKQAEKSKGVPLACDM